MATQRKVSADPPSSNDKVQRSKASWTDLKVNEIFIQTCLDQVIKGERIGTSFTKKGWKNIVCQFHESTGRDYDKNQLKNRYDTLKMEWRVWFDLFGKVTGMGWNNERNTFDAPDEWWENKQLENPLYGKFREKGLPFAHELTTLFKGVVANGEHAWAPSSGILPNEDGGIDVGDFGPGQNNIDLDVGEGSGDSEDASIGATGEFANINLNISQGDASRSSGQKRKRVRGVDKKTKKKTTPALAIAEAVKEIAETCKARNDVINNASIGVVMAELHSMDEITSDIDLFMKCCQLMMYKPAREMFVSFEGFKDRRLDWLKHAANNPLPFMKM
ncbi:putative Myb/SANT-like domain-containing protein [Medicago truncatula]|uniref:Myb/SANT-like DNA-binding domain protein n=1 Tax=Medicago truncatula TaxID=3880 RepID=A0A072TK40_MEDTR|nr:L10-interacting MYB domain-containing protein [Medicago truncatula]XP_039684467.1 L10-interacting MYB domain-containing protein [Medicago truncatula]XP_039684475.1 L10-interacting MYB domain-containing protein-like [Medicago truncatula]XP_039684477.1 L10-interacting MYB domain-containing protein-like [Medicago truncatula]KEH17807.1 Myb/SANT-like DNA-binding domain protein [Medicago truncatula]KEH17819.1 Myb/SANT-like DNA-binding domain protein [Medicago truncatula]KEH36046.1 Myb/SANT-like 